MINRLLQYSKKAFCFIIVVYKKLYYKINFCTSLYFIVMYIVCNNNQNTVLNRFKCKTVNNNIYE